jgi:hypothetical protein
MPEVRADASSSAPGIEGIGVKNLVVIQGRPYLKYDYTSRTVEISNAAEGNGSREFNWGREPDFVKLFRDRRRDNAADLLEAAVSRFGYNAADRSEVTALG